MSGLEIDNISMRFELPGGGSVQALERRQLEPEKRRIVECARPVGLRQDNFAEYRGRFSGANRRRDPAERRGC